MNESKNKKVNILFKIVEAKKISYYENDLSDLGLKDKKYNNSTVDYGVASQIDEERGKIQIKFIAKFYLKEDEKKLDLFGVETVHGFKIQNFKKVILKVKNQYKIPDSLMLTFLNLSVSGSRGMLAILNSKPEFSNIFFPIINTKGLLNLIKKSK